MIAKRWIRGAQTVSFSANTSDGRKVVVVMSCRRDQNDFVVLDCVQCTLEESASLLVSSRGFRLCYITNEQLASQHTRLQERGLSLPLFRHL
jgi:hypothetical protein